VDETIKVPEERIGVIIGPSGSIRKTIERKTNCKVFVDSDSGDVVIEGEGEDFFKAVDIVKAIARGFSPERAFTLMNGEKLLKIIDIEDIVGKNASKQKAKRGRVIGRKGLARNSIEKKTGALVSVQGKTVALIARNEEMEAAIESVEMLLGGANHDTVERVLDRKGRERFEL
jgi:ribosomal RNA assembly protein